MPKIKKEELLSALEEWDNRYDELEDEMWLYPTYEAFKLAVGDFEFPTDCVVELTNNNLKI